MIVGVLLAAGTGSRFEGGNKLLADLDDEPVVAHAARTLTESSLDAAVAVVGHDRERVADALPPGIQPVHNPEYEQGQSTSVRRGIEAARERGAEAVLFALGDMPRVRVGTVEAMLDAYRTEKAETKPGIVAPRFEGRRGNPVLFDARYFDDLASVEGDRGGRVLLDSEPVAWVDAADPGVRRDVDTERDLRDLEGLQDDSDSDSADGSDATSDRG